MKKVLYVFFIIIIYLYASYGALISGHVDNQTQYGYMDLKVRAISNGESGANFFPTSLDVDYNYTVDGLPIGAYIVEVFVDMDNDDNPDLETPILCYQISGDTMCTVVNIVTENDQITNIDILFDEGHSGPPIGSGRLIGMITNNTEYEREVIRVQAILSDPNGDIFYKVGLNVDNSYEIDSLPPGNYRVEAYIDSDGDGAPDPDTPVSCYHVTGDSICSEIELLDGEEKTGIDIVLGVEEYRPIGSISGFIINYTNFIFSDIKVRAVSHMENGDIFYPTSVNEDYSYIIDSLPSNIYILEVYIDQNGDNIPDSGKPINCYQIEDDTLCTELIVNDGDNIEGIDIDFGESPQIGNSIIEGKVINLSPYKDDIYVIANLILEDSDTLFIVPLNQDSTYIFENLPPGEYKIFAVIDTNHNGTADSLDYFRCYRQEGELDECTHIMLGDNFHLQHIDIIFESVTPIGSAKIKGQVDNQTKFDESSIIVQANMLEDNSIRKVTASADGNFEITQLLPGTYLVEAFIDLNENGLFDSSEVINCYKIEGDTLCTDIILDSGEVYNNVNIVLESEEEQNNSSLSGNVISNKDGIGPIVVVCESGNYYKRIVLDSPGTFIFNHLPTGLYNLFAFEDLNEDSLLTDGELWNCYKIGDNTECDSIFVGVNEQVKDKNIQLFYPYLRIRGIVVDSTNTSEGVIYALLNEDSLIHSNSILRIPVNENNEFVMDIFMEGTFYLFVHKDMDNNLSIDDQDYFGIYDIDGNGLIDPIVIDGFMDDINVSINVNKKIGESMEKKAFIKGAIIMPPDGPVNYFAVRAIDAVGNFFQVMADSQTFEYSLLVVPGTYYVLTEETENYFSTFYRNTTNMTEAIMVTVTNNDTLKNINIEVKQKIIFMGSLYGTVYDSVSGNPLAEVFLRLYNDSLDYNTVTDSVGNYLFDEVNAVEYSLDLNKEGFEALHKERISIIKDSTIFYNVNIIPLNIDSIPPDIIPIYPDENDSNVIVNTNIILDIIDYQSGINRNSLALSIGDIPVEFQSADIPDGVRITYMPQQHLPEGDTIFIDVSVYDNNMNFSQKHYYFITESDKEPPTYIIEPSVTQISTNSATISFSTDEPSQAEIFYYIENTYDTLNFLTGYFATVFDIILDNLNSNTKYNYFVKIRDKNYNGPVLSKENSFKTLAEVDRVAPVFINGPYSSNISSFNAWISFQADEPVYAKVYYDTVSNNFANVFIDTLINKRHDIMLSNLISDMQYFYKVEIFDQDSNFNMSQILDFKTSKEADKIPPVFIQGPSIVNASYNSATLFGITDEISQITVSVIFTDGKSFSITDDFNTLHNIIIPDLESSTKYSYTLFAIDMFGNKTDQFEGTFSTSDAPDSIAPEILNVRAINPTENSITIVWENNEPASGQIFYGIDSTQMMIVTEPIFSVSHSIIISQLLSDTLYYYYIKAFDPATNISNSTMFTFRTNSIVDTKAPIIIAGPGIVSYDDKAIFSFTTDEPAITIVDYWKENNPEYIMTVSETEFYEIHSIILTGLEPSKTYQIRAIINDRAGNQTIWPKGENTSALNKQESKKFITTFMLRKILQTQTNSFNTNSNADTISPNIVEGPTAYERSNNFITIYWKTDEPAIGEVYYGEIGYFENYQTESEYLTDHYMTIYNLSQNSKYNFIIFNTDVNGNGPVQYSDTLVYKTKALADNYPPDIVEGIYITDISSDRAVLVAKTDKASLLKVKLFDNSELIKDYATSVRKKDFKVFLTNLEAAKEYVSESDICDADGNCNTDNQKTFNTMSVPDNTPPLINDTSVIIGKDYFKFDISFDELSTVLLEYRGLNSTDFISVSSLSPSTYHELMITNLTLNTMYKVKVYYQDTYGNVDSISSLMIATLAEPDSVPPSVPEGLDYSLSSGRLKFYWNSVIDNDFKAYNIYIKEDSGEQFNKVGSNIIDTFFIDERENFNGIEYGVSAVDIEGNESNINSILISATKISEKKEILPKKFVVLNNYPNPFNPSTVIKYYLPDNNYVDIVIFNIIGQIVYKERKKRNAGWHRFIWKTDSDISSGIYFYKIKIDNNYVVKKMIILK